MTRTFNFLRAASNYYSEHVWILSSSQFQGRLQLVSYQRDIVKMKHSSLSLRSINFYYNYDLTRARELREFRLRMRFGGRIATTVTRDTVWNVGQKFLKWVEEAPLKHNISLWKEFGHSYHRYCRDIRLKENEEDSYNGC